MKKALRAEAIMGGTVLASGVILLAMPRSFTKWDESPLDDAWGNLKEAWTQGPVWDQDIFFHNYIGHPYAGSLYYNMVRSQGATRRQSFYFALFQSTLWECVFEAVAERPSIQDLILTPVGGALVGELFHSLTLKILRDGRANFFEKILVTLMNPSYVINNGYRSPESPVFP